MEVSSDGRHLPDTLETSARAGPLRGPEGRQTANSELNKELAFSPVVIAAMEESHAGPPVGWPGVYL